MLNDINIFLCIHLRACTYVHMMSVFFDFLYVLITQGGDTTESINISRSWKLPKALEYEPTDNTHYIATQHVWKIVLLFTSRFTRTLVRPQAS